MRKVIFAVVSVIAISLAGLYVLGGPTKKEPSKAELCRTASKNQLEIVAETKAQVSSSETYYRMKKSNPYAAKQLREGVWSIFRTEYDLPSDPSARWDRFQTNCEGDKWTKEQIVCLTKGKTILDLKLCGAFEGAGNW